MASASVAVSKTLKTLLPNASNACIIYHVHVTALAFFLYSFLIAAVLSSPPRLQTWSSVVTGKAENSSRRVGARRGKAEIREKKQNLCAEKKTYMDISYNPNCRCTFGAAGVQNSSRSGTVHLLLLLQKLHKRTQ